MSKQSRDNGEQFSECGSEIEMNEPEVMIDATSPPDDVTKHVHQFLEYVRGKGDITKGESVVSMDVWDFAGQQLYYASHPLFLSSHALYILVHNLSKPLLAQAQPCVRQGTRNIPLENPNSETNLENLLSWLTTIHSITQVKEEPGPVIGTQRRLAHLQPPVLVVGTHADKQSPQDIAKIKSEIRKRISGKEYGKHVVPPLFSIDNTSSLKWNRIKRVFRKHPKERKHQTGINKYWLRYYNLDIMDISTHCYCASFLCMKFTLQCHATSYFKHARQGQNISKSRAWHRVLLLFLELTLVLLVICRSILS